MMLKIGNRRIQIVFVTIIIAIATIRFCAAEVFTAITEMENLLDTEAILINNLEAYVEAQEKKLNFLRRRIGEYQREHNEASKDIIKYISNPINAYLLTKRLTSDWSIVEQVMLYNLANDYLENVTLHRDLFYFPSDEDLKGAAIAIIRLQDVYELSTAEIARGEINGIKCSWQMSSHDCFELGRQSYLNSDFHHAIMWLNEAMARLNNNVNEPKILLETDIMELMATCMFKQGDIHRALEITNELLKLAPNHEQATRNKTFYERELVNEVKANDKNVILNDDDLPKLEKSQLEVAYGKLCRGEIVRDGKFLSKLKCRYVTNKSPFLKIAPLKLEEASLTPYIVVYHDVIYDREIELIKQMAKPRFNRATVLNSKTGEKEIATFRISKSSWLSDYYDVVRTIGIRVEDMTGLSVSTAEYLQVVNYGIGGHYEPHYDFSVPGETGLDYLGTGNRIATVLFYMSDVAQGGATVFTDINLTLWPKKGSAAFWLNLHPNGDGDILTRHAACPVLIGSKWVCNKWLHVYGQEFLRPCALNRYEP